MGCWPHSAPSLGLCVTKSLSNKPTNWKQLTPLTQITSASLWHFGRIFLILKIKQHILTRTINYDLLRNFYFVLILTRIIIIVWRHVNDAKDVILCIYSYLCVTNYALLPLAGHQAETWITHSEATIQLRLLNQKQDEEPTSKSQLDQSPYQMFAQLFSCNS